jgi:AraC-like DNA-binding protein
VDGIPLARCGPDLWGRFVSTDSCCEDLPFTDADVPMPHRPSNYRDAPTRILDNRTEVGGDTLHLSLYEVREPMRGLALHAPHLLYYGMVQGTQVVRANGEAPLRFSAGESLVVPPLQTLTVDFPQADETPVRYIAVQVNPDEMWSLFSEHTDSVFDPSSYRTWKFSEQHYCHVQNSPAISKSLELLSHLFGSTVPNKHTLLDLHATGLMVQMLQTPSRPLLLGEFSRHTSEGGLAAVVQYVQANLHRHISIDELVEESCMSKSSFYRHFSEEFDMSPLEYITRERIIRARELLSDAERTVTEVSHELGFSSTSHFIDMFKDHEGITPKQYQLDVTQ